MADTDVTTPEAPAVEDTAKKAPARAKAKADAEPELPCPHCFRWGWPDTATALGCEHGNWTR